MNDDKTFIMAGNWPHWPLCPLKRKDNKLENKNLGFLVDGSLTTIHHGYVFSPGIIRDLPKTEYESLDALLADGWRVD